MRRGWALVVMACGCQPLSLPSVELPPAVAADADDEAPPVTEGRSRPILATSDRCDDDPEGCVRLGVRLTRTDLPRAAGLFQDACAAGSAAGCGNLAVLVRDGRGVAADDTRARELFGRACDGGDTRSCDNLAAL